MKKTIFAITLFAALLITGCKKPVFTYVHNDVTITSITVTNLGAPDVPDFPGKPLFASVTGQINQETGEILFPIPRADADKFDLKRMKAYASIRLDAKFDPPLTGIHDFSEDFPVRVYSLQTGDYKDYVLKVYFSRY
ncbi:MAG: hypothetical protein J6X39_06410 [Bacteroidales bacterium]|nr:hypothetical protein [Bacteroidales bacterium]